MTVFVDDLRRLIAIGEVCDRHSRLFADSEAELHEFAAGIGLHRRLAYHPGTPYAHYLVRERHRRRAVAAGAVEIPSADLDQMINTRRQAGLRALRVIANAIGRTSSPTSEGVDRLGPPWRDRAAFLAAMAARRTARIAI